MRKYGKTFLGFYTETEVKWNSRRPLCTRRLILLNFVIFIVKFTFLTPMRSKNLNPQKVFLASNCFILFLFFIQKSFVFLHISAQRDSIVCIWCQPPQTSDSKRSAVCSVLFFVMIWKVFTCSLYNIKPEKHFLKLRENF